MTCARLVYYVIFKLVSTIILLILPNNGVLSRKLQVTSPVLNKCGVSECGYQHSLPMFYAYDETGKQYDPYILNRTANSLKKEGFHIEVTQMYSDAISNFTYSNNITRKYKELKTITGMSAVGGHPSLKTRSYYMALLGEKKDKNINWYCDGVLINKQWIVTVAHCFHHRNIKINIVRLGEYDWSNSTKEVPFAEKPQDYDIENIVFYPKFKPQSRYHDLALVKLNKPFPNIQQNINPICLPWNTETNKNHTGNTLTLSGWGATSYESVIKNKSHALQEVQLTVFNAKVCDQSYSRMIDYKTKWSFGIDDNYILCAGSNNGGKDACKGDSGAPLVYENDKGNYVLAAIVSSGFGCGLKDYPGIYIPINKPIYLQWIKKIAFSACL